MSDHWPLVLLGEVLTQRKEFVQIDDEHEYKRCRVQLHAQGVVLRDIVPGAAIKTKRQQVCHAGEFLVAEIDAKVGGFGLVPASLEGAIVSSHYFLFCVNTAKVEPRFLDFYIRTREFREQVSAQGTTNYAAVRPGDVLTYQMPLPPLHEQRRIVVRIEELAGKIGEARGLREQSVDEAQRMLMSVYAGVVEGARRLPMAEVAPLVRRPVKVSLTNTYYELGIRSFGKGTFHKPAIDGVSLGTKRIFRIEPGDLVFNIVFAWEGAVAVAKPEDKGRVGSHRFLTCVPKSGLATSPFLRFHFLTDHGVERLGLASPGGAGRNRTLSIKGLESILVPVPPFDKQLWFDQLQARVDEYSGPRNLDSATRLKT